MNPMAHKMADLLERCFVIAALLVMTEALIPLWSISAGSGGHEMSSGARTMWLLTFGGVFAMTGLLVLARSRRFIRVCRANIALMVLPGIAFASVFWSVAPDLTLRRAIVLAAATVFGFYLVTRFTPEQFLRLLAAMLGLAAVLSIALAVVRPELGVHAFGTHQGDWHGIFKQKNVLGRLMALGCIVMIVLALRGERYRSLCWVGAAACASLVFLSGGRTAWLVLVLLTISYPLLHLLRAHLSILAPGLLLAMLTLPAGVVWLVNHSDAVFGAMGRDVTLTGRTSLWLLSAEIGMQRPWLGHGFSAFWFEDGPAAGIPGVLGWGGPNAHNGFLDAWLELGLLGLGAMVLTLALYAGRAIKRLRENTQAIAPWYGLFLLYIMGMNGASSMLYGQDHFTWVIFIATLAYTTAASTVASGHTADADVDVEPRFEPLPAGRGAMPGGRW